MGRQRPVAYVLILVQGVFEGIPSAIRPIMGGAISDWGGGQCDVFGSSSGGCAVVAPHALRNSANPSSSSEDVSDHSSRIDLPQIRDPPAPDSVLRSNSG